MNQDPQHKFNLFTIEDESECVLKKCCKKYKKKKGKHCKDCPKK